MQNGLRGFVRSLGVPNLRKWLAGLGAIAAAGGATLLLSAQAPAAGTDPAKIAAALQSCEAGNLQDCYVYGRSMWNKERTPKETVLTFNSLEKACRGQVTEACTAAAYGYIVGYGRKIDLKKARQLAALGCDADKTLACDIVKRLDNPPRSSGELSKLPSEYQSTINGALYFDADGGKILFDLSFTKPIGDTPQYSYPLAAAACEMQYFQACPRASVGFAAAKGYKAPYITDLPRSSGLSQIGCDGGVTLSCYMLGTTLQIQNNGYQTSASRAAFKKTRPDFDKKCEDGSSLYCGRVASYYDDGGAENNDYGQAAYYYQKACNLGDSHSCDKMTIAQTAYAKQEAEAREVRGQRYREQQIANAKSAPYPTDPDTIRRCETYSKKFNAEIEDFNRRGDAIVANKDDVALMWDKGKNSRALYEASESSCMRMLDIAEKAAGDSCSGNMYSSMMSQISQFESLSGSGECYKRSLEMGASWNNRRY